MAKTRIEDGQQYSSLLKAQRFAEVVFGIFRVKIMKSPACFKIYLSNISHCNKNQVYATNNRQ